MNADDLFAPRRCFVEPIPEIWIAAELLHEAVNAHLSGAIDRADALIREADILTIANWTNSIWGPFDPNIHRLRQVQDCPPTLPVEARPMPRMPTAATKKLVKLRDGCFCRFCGIPVIDASVREKIRKMYPIALRWGGKNVEQHAAFQCMWLQYDHVLPNSRGGDSSADNVVITCGACNYGRNEWTLEEVGLIDPRSAFQSHTWRGADSWCGLEHFV